MECTVWGVVLSVLGLWPVLCFLLLLVLLVPFAEIVRNSRDMYLREPNAGGGGGVGVG